MLNISIVIPMYNEEKSIARVLSQIKEVMKKQKCEYEIIVVDDGSNDGSIEILNKYEGIKLIRHSSNRGYGSAIKSGIMEVEGSYILLLDADGTYQPEEIPKLLNRLVERGCDMVVGARIGEKVRDSFIRRPAKLFINKLASYLAGMKIPDLNSGMRIMKTEVVKKYFHILPDKFSFTTTITLAMITNNYEVEFVPINYHRRMAGSSSKMGTVGTTMNFVQLIIRTIMYFNPLKIFLPLSLFFFITSLCIFLYSKIFLGKLIMDITVILLFVFGIQILAIGMLADLIDKRIR